MDAEQRLARLREKQRERGRRYRERKAEQGLKRTWAQADGAERALEAITRPDIARGPVEMLPVDYYGVKIDEKPTRQKRARTMLATDKDWIEAFRDQFWPAWLQTGRECSKAAAALAWAKVPHPDAEGDFNKLMDRMEADVAKWRAEGRDVKFYPHAATWLNDYARTSVLEREGLI